MTLKAGARRVLDTAMYAFGLMLVLNLAILVFQLDNVVFQILAGALAVACLAAGTRAAMAERRGP